MRLAAFISWAMFNLVQASNFLGSLHLTKTRTWYYKYDRTRVSGNRVGPDHWSGSITCNLAIGQSGIIH